MAQSLSETKQNQRRRKVLTASVVWSVFSVFGALLFLLGTTPDRAGPLGITLFFILVFIGLLSLGTILRLWLAQLADSRGQLTVVLIAGASTAALAIGTIELQLGDIILLGLFVLTFSIYWYKLR